MDTTICLELAAKYRLNLQLKQYYPEETRTIKKYIQKNLQRGCIQRCTSKISIGFIFIPKEGTNELRVCGNYTPLNGVLKQRTNAPPPTAACRDNILRATRYSEYDIEQLILPSTRAPLQDEGAYTMAFQRPRCLRFRPDDLTRIATSVRYLCICTLSSRTDFTRYLVAEIPRETKAPRAANSRNYLAEVRLFRCVLKNESQT